ncbi:hypothetical protein AB0H88_35245 [Nonomuraea sp. NPDC050680]|uniref:hypothetical protein n=1 Tax=Nonomuraea sp. NPDC050680 TaxID=3154630 RepID=UPI0033F81050
MGQESDGQGSSTAAVRSSHLWRLEASPSTLETIADSWRTLETKAASAEGKVHDAAQAVFNKDEWVGDSADAFNKYRKRLTSDMELFGAQAGNVGGVLDSMASVLQTYQGLLDDEWDKLKHVPVTEDLNGLTFRPKNAEQATLVSTAISTATEMRTRLDDLLDAKRQELAYYKEQFDAHAKQWKPRTLTMLNLNVGQGAGNAWRDKNGTDPEDIPGMAKLIAGSGADVVTLQEVFKKDIDAGFKANSAFDLKHSLERETGVKWEVRFEEASRKYQASDSIPILGDNWHQPFGNAVLVRQGDAIESVGDGENIKLDAPGSKITLPGNAPGMGNVEIEDGEGRSAAKTEIRFKPR